MTLPFSCRCSVVQAEYDAQYEAQLQDRVESEVKQVSDHPTIAHFAQLCLTVWLFVDCTFESRN
mgnify:CR=1 FL=1